jgi:hypothetical protein
MPSITRFTVDSFRFDAKGGFRRTQMFRAYIYAASSIAPTPAKARGRSKETAISVIGSLSNVATPPTMRSARPLSAFESLPLSLGVGRIFLRLGWTDHSAVWGAISGEPERVVAHLPL